MKISFFFLGLFTLFLFIEGKGLVDNGQELFFPKELYSKVSNFNNFEIGKWNNIIIKNEDDALNLCHELKNNHKELIAKIMCGPKLNEFLPYIQSWLSDQFLNFTAPKIDKFNESAKIEITKLSLPMGPDGPNIIDLVRMDPLNYKIVLLEKLQGPINDNFIWKNGLLVNKNDGMIIIPFQLTFRPEEIKKTKEFEKILIKYNASLIGVHEGHLSNREVIEEDLQRVGMISSLMIVIFLSVAIYLKLFKLIKLIVPTFLGICVSFFFTWLIYGKIHGITLSFGTGIIGLAIDYGFHYVFSKDKKLAWKSNFYALITSLIVFIIFFFSSIPLIRQMMFFSILGLITSYIFSRLLLSTDHIEIKTDIIFKKNKWHALTIIAALIGIFHLVFLKIDTSVGRFNFTPAHIKEAQSWFFSQVKTEKIFFKIYEQNNWGDIQTDAQNIKLQKIRSENIFSYTPSLVMQKQNLDSWITFRNDFKNFPKLEAKIFEPFLLHLMNVTPSKAIDLGHPPEYLRHLVAENKVINLWFTKGPDQEKLLKKNVKRIDSLVDIFMNFTGLLTKEITIFMPITLIAIWLILYLRYSSFIKTFLCLLPFLFSLGLYGLCHRYLNFPLSFMGLLGLFLLYGLSVDYGIFTIDYFTNNEQNSKYESSLNLGLLVNWVSGMLGFLPLLWCKHPILNDLGLVLNIGMLGIFYSTFFIVPGVFLLRKNT